MIQRLHRRTMAKVPFALTVVCVNVRGQRCENGQHTEDVLFGVSRQTAPRRGITSMEATMAESVYKVIELIGTSPESWEKAAKAAVERAGQSLRDLRVAEVVEQDLVIENGKVTAYRSKMKVSFKYEDDKG